MLVYRVKRRICPVVYQCAPEVTGRGHVLDRLGVFNTVGVVKASSMIPKSLKVLVTVWQKNHQRRENWRRIPEMFDGLQIARKHRQTLLKFPLETLLYN